MENQAGFGGYQRIYADLLQELAQADIPALAGSLGLALTPEGEAAIPFLGATYRIGPQGIRRSDGLGFREVTASGLIRYLLAGSLHRPAGEFVTFAALAGPLFDQGGYSASALEAPIVKRFQGRVSELLRVASALGGQVAGEGGLGSLSLIFELLPHVRLQLIFYDRDEEFPARATLLFDRNATQVLDFETLAVLVTVFVNALTKSDGAGNG